jgi:cysteinyl-tRNA synthetase
MKVYNTLTRQLEEFKLERKDRVTFYQCGPTVYWIQHIGNLRAMVWADLIRRSLNYLGYKTMFVRNYTDVGHLVSDADEGEDKMEKGAKREGLTPDQIADKYIKIFENDTKKLNIVPPDFRPRATHYVLQMVEMIKILLEKKHAYRTDYAVYFDVSTFPNYNQLNKQKIDLNIKGAGKGTIEDRQKKHFADFALWFFKKGSHANALQTWTSPWGEGFPGWHIECSVMAKELLGKTIDIHMGGVEHIPIHHTNEIAQSESANGDRFVNYWLHNEHLGVNEKKMAKSEGSSYTLNDIIEKGFNPLDLRYFFLSAHYRSKQNFTWEALSAAKEGYNRLKHTIISLRKQTDRTILSNEKLLQVDKFRSYFSESLSEDFQIPEALGLMWSMLKSNIPSQDKLDLLLQFDQVFGLKLSEVSEPQIPNDIINLKEQRDQFRKAGNYSASDIIKDEIVKRGFSVQDTNQGTVVFPRNSKIKP